jgi:hypothetical protein
VLGAILLGIIVLFVSCFGNDPDDTRGKGGKPAPTSRYPEPTPDETEPSFLAGVPGGNNPSLPSLGDLQSTPPGDDGTGTGTGTGTGPGQPTAGGTGQNTNVTAAADGSCSDQEFSVVASAASPTLKRGAALELALTVKNIGTRSCTRDVGAGPQELYLVQGSRTYWSSDVCSPNKTSDVRLFNPGNQRNYKVTWNGRQSSTCTNSQPAGPVPPAGQFELRARLGTLVSQPIPLTIVE